MMNYAKEKNLTQFISMQNCTSLPSTCRRTALTSVAVEWMMAVHNAAYREEEREMIPLCQQLGVGIIPWSPLNMSVSLLFLPSRTHRIELTLKEWFLVQQGHAGATVRGREDGEERRQVL